MKVVIVVLASLLLSGCLNAAITIPPIDQAKIYQGYPCRDQCDAFKRGYDAAKKAMINSKDQCISQNDVERLGCQAYVTDYRYASNPDMELMNGLNQNKQ